MDLAVTGLYMEDRQAVIIELNKLASAIQDWKCIESFKCIETASIPVIKMVSLIHYLFFFSQKINITKLRETEMNLAINSKVISDESNLLSIDITFDDSNSSAQPTSVFMNP